MTGPFLAFAFDVPRRLARGKLLWVFLLISLLWLLIPLLLAATTDASGHKVLTFAGKPWMDDSRPGQGAPPPIDPEEMVRILIGGIFGIFLACYAGPFSGLVLLADAVPSAFAPGSAEINVPKPVHRSTIVLARHVGGLLVASGFLVLIVGGSTGLALARTGILSIRIFWAIPCAVLLFGLLHALGSAAGIASRNAFVGAFAALGLWFLGTITQWIGKMAGTPMTKSMPILDWVCVGTKWAHRILPRANELPALCESLIDMTPGNAPGADPASMLDQKELITQSLVWWGIALGVACLVARRRDF